MVAWRIRQTALGLLFIPTLALADPNIGATPPPAKFPPLEIDFGGHLGLFSGDRCTRQLSDVVACSSGVGLAGAHFGPGYRVLPRLVVGVAGAVSFSSQSKTWWQTTLGFRVYPLGRGHEGLWFGGGGGVVAIVEKVEADELGPAETLTHAAPLFTVASGVNFSVLRTLQVGPELRAFVVPFGRPDALPDRGTAFETQIGAWAGLTATFLLGELN
jgi:hypothetical protein